MMVRVVLVAILLALPAHAATGWSRYVNPTYGAAVDIPPGFKVDAPARKSGDGRVFRADNGRSTITVWGGRVGRDSFSREVSDRIRADEAEGWSITYRSETPTWAAWSGSRGGHVFFAKAIAACGGEQTANVRMVYPALDIPSFDPIVNRLSTSLGQDGGCY